VKGMARENTDTTTLNRAASAAAAAGLVAVVVALTVGAVMIPCGLMSRREPTLASG